MSTSYIDTILNLLYAGEKVRISFPTPSLRETFRKKLYAKKREQDEALEALLEEYSKVLHYQRCDLGQDFQAVCWLQEKVTYISFEVIKEEIEQTEQLEEEQNILREDETLSANLAATPKQPKQNS